MSHYTDFKSIQKFTRSASYEIDVSWLSVERTLEELSRPYGLDLDPDFQRAHVWTEKQQIRYVEFRLRDGHSGGQIQFNQSGWMKASESRGEPVCLVDGKQRLEAVRRFLANEIPAFGTLYQDYTSVMRLMSGGARFRFCVNDLATRAEVLQWYIDLNAGGVAHTDDEIGNVRALLAREIAS